MFNKTPLEFNGIAIIGEAPGRDEVYKGEPFVGASGRFLRLVLRKANIDPNQCFYGNICQRQPKDNDINNFVFMGPEYVEGLTQLTADLGELRPSICLLLGNTPLRMFKSTGDSISNWRGSVFYANINAPCPGAKCIATYHPAAVLRQYDWAPLFHFDLLKAERHSHTQELGTINRLYDTTLDFDSLIRSLRAIREKKKIISVDIEGGVDGIPCIGFATSRAYAFVVPFTSRDGVSLWTLDQEVELWKEVADVLSDPLVPKVLQNSLYDNFVLSYRMKIPILNVVDDTMLKHWELYPELEKSLAFQTSIYTEHQYYKSDIKSDSFQTFLRYCATDCAVTYEINDVLSRQLRGRSHKHYRFNVQLLSPCLYMELRGFKYDTSKLPDKQRVVRTKLFDSQAKLDAAAGRGLDKTLSSGGRLDVIKPIVVQKRLQRYTIGWNNVASNCLGTYKDDIHRIVELGSKETLTAAENAELSSLCGLGMNIRGKEFKPWFFDKLGMPRYYNDAGNLTADYLTLLKIVKKTNHAVPLLVLDIADARTHLQMLSISTDPDGRVRCGYNLVGTDTGRMSCYTSPTGSGYNLTTIPEYDRDLFVADEGNWMFQCDLSGADGWTVACHCAAHGDSTMLDDLRGGIKIAKVIAAMVRFGPEVTKLDRSELKELTNRIEKSDTIYFACKCVQHGTNYGMKDQTMSDTILKMSEGKIFVEPKVCNYYRSLYLMRYRGIIRWHEASQTRLDATQRLECASGHTRICMGRPDDHNTFMSFLSSEPQNNTCYATNHALHNLWHDPENRVGSKLVIEPLHQVHDALVGQFPKDRTEWALAKIKTYFVNPITIAGIPVTIPFEGRYGPSWGELVHEF